LREGELRKRHGFQVAFKWLSSVNTSGGCAHVTRRMVVTKVEREAGAGGTNRTKKKRYFNAIYDNIN